MLARRVGFPPVARDVGSNDVPGDHRIGRRQTWRQKQVECPERLRFGAVLVAGRPLEREEALERGGEGRRERINW